MQITNELPLAGAPALGVDEAYRAFKRTGYVVFPSVIDRDLIAAMYRVWEEYFVPFSTRRPDLRRFLMHLPFKPPLYDARFLEDPRVLQVVDRALGPDCVIGYFGSETPLPGAPEQQPHFDLAFLHKRRFLNPALDAANRILGSCNFCYGIQVSLPLVDSRLDNAPFEIWPGTNRVTFRATESTLVTMPAGSLLVRDIRNRHRGTPHHGDAARPFVSLVYLRSWVPAWKPPEIPSDVYRALPPRSQRLFRHATIGQAVPDPEAWADRRRR